MIISECNHVYFIIAHCQSLLMAFSRTSRNTATIQEKSNIAFHSLWLNKFNSINIKAYLANSASCFGSDKSIPGMPPGGSFLPVMYSE